MAPTQAPPPEERTTTGVPRTLAPMTPTLAPGAASPRVGEAPAWPQGPHAEAMLSFNLLPSRWLHPSRWPALLPPGWRAPADADHAAHRHASALILRQLGAAAQPVTDWQRPEWPVALLPAACWQRVLLRLGLVLALPALRRAIGGTELRALAADIGDAELAWARQRAPDRPPGLPDADELPALPQLGPRLPRLGADVLAAAVRAAPAPMRQRLALRAPMASPWKTDVAATRAAWSLLLTLIDELDPPWRSSFPATR